MLVVGDSYLFWFNLMVWWLNCLLATFFGLVVNSLLAAVVWFVIVTCWLFVWSFYLRNSSIMLTCVRLLLP